MAKDNEYICEYHKTQLCGCLSYCDDCEIVKIKEDQEEIKEDKTELQIAVEKARNDMAGIESVFLKVKWSESDE